MMRAKKDEVTAPNLTQLKNGQAWMKIQSCLAPESPSSFCSTTLSLPEGCYSNQSSIQKTIATLGISSRKEFNTEN